MRPMSEPDLVPAPSPASAAPKRPPRRTARATSPDPRDPRLGAWRAFLVSHSLISRRLDEELRLEQGLSLAEYDALVQLAYSPARTLRMNQLADRVLLSRSGVTRLVDRLEADGLVTRASCASDARGAQAVLTEAGLARLRAASETHLRGVEHYFFAALAPADLVSLQRALDAVADRSARRTAADDCDRLPAPGGDPTARA